MTEVNVKDSATVWRELTAASKKKKGGPYTRYVNRNAAIPLTWLLWKLGLTPNAVSLISITITHVAFVVLILFRTELAAAIAAYLLLVLGYMLDSCDGQLARVTGRTSRLGEWLDHTLDVVKLLNINLTLSYLIITSAIAMDEPLTLPFLAAALNLLSQPAHFFVINMKVALFDDSEQQAASGDGGGGLIQSGVRFIADYGVFILLVLLLPWQELFLPAYAAYGGFCLLLLVAHFVRTARRIAAM